MSAYDDWKADDSDARADDYAEYEEWLALERAAYFERKARRASKLDPLDAPVVWIRPIEIADEDIPF